MKRNSTRKSTDENSSLAPNCAAILAILAEMARRLNENISKIQLKPLDSALVPAGLPERAESSKA
jgi:hypothetical protein